MPLTEPPGFVQIEDQTWMGCNQAGSAFIALFGSNDRTTSEVLMHQIVQKLPSL